MNHDHSYKDSTTKSWLFVEQKETKRIPITTVTQSDTQRLIVENALANRLISRAVKCVL